jgi:hypothetical protein
MKQESEEFDDLSSARRRHAELTRIGWKPKLIQSPDLSENVLVVYPSDDNRTVNDFNGRHVGRVVSVNRYKFGRNPGDIVFTYRVNVGGKLWYGRGLGENMALTLRPMAD